MEIGLIAILLLVVQVVLGATRLDTRPRLTRLPEAKTIGPISSDYSIPAYRSSDREQLYRAFSTLHALSQVRTTPLVENVLLTITYQRHIINHLILRLYLWWVTKQVVKAH